jgi:diaminopimelate decarboxylase
MHYFTYKNNYLCCEEIPIDQIIKKFGTPLYIYSAKTILNHFYKIQRAFSSIDPLICYSVKANSNLSLLKLLVKKGAGLDIVSGGELYRAKKVGCPAKKIVYASVGKTRDEIKDALSYGILMFNVESLEELKRINEIARRTKKYVRCALRVNPDIEARTHSYITTGKRETKFGMDIDTVKGILLQRSRFPYLKIVGIHLHIGSQITSVSPYLKAIKKVRTLIKEVRQRGGALEYLNIGGGLGIVYDKEKPQTARDFSLKILPLLKEINLKVILEPGRFIVGNAGILVTKVLYIKSSYRKKFIIVDAAMNDLMRPALYGAYHKIIPLEKSSRHTHQTPLIKGADIVGPICETGDFLGKARTISTKEGAYLAILGAGAYGFSMSSNYNSRPRAAEVLVKNKRVCLVRTRELYKELIRKEIII